MPNLNSEENVENNNTINLQNEVNIEKKIKIHEKLNTPGIFEHTVPPGRYLLEVEKYNYETIRKFIDLEKGANSINVEMSVERYCNLHIYVYNYENFQEESYIPIKNVDIIIYQNSNEILEESITNNKGEFNYKVNKGEDFLTIVVSKLGYYPVQRIFMRNKDSPINENGEYEENLTFFLVKESFIIENNCVLCVTYSSFTDVNFDPNGIQISDNIKNKINLSCYDGQKENGIISTFIKYKTKQEISPNSNSNNEKNSSNLEEQKNNNNLQNSENQENINENENNDINNNNYLNENNNNENIEGNTSSNNENEENEEIENYDNIISISFIIQTEALKNNNYQDKGFTMNGLERYGCQTIIYTPKNVFNITAPSFCDYGYSLWNIGWIDIKNQLFYQTNSLTESLNDRIVYFNCWVEFLQALIDNKIYSKIFKFFCFDKAILLNNDRYIDENIFIECLKKLDFCKENEEDIMPFITSLFKSNNNMISLAIVKKKISSNLKNFSDEAINGRTYVENSNDDNFIYENQ